MRPLRFYSSVLKKILTQTYMTPSRTNYLSTEKQAKERTFMAMCDECDCYDDNYIDGEDITEEELENDPLYEPHRYYYWHGDIQEDYQMPPGYDLFMRVLLR